jgi:hypothetical protein
MDEPDLARQDENIEMLWVKCYGRWINTTCKKTKYESQQRIEWIAPPSNDRVDPSHPLTYGSRIRRFAIHLFKRSLHQSKLLCTFLKDYRFSEGCPLTKINAP